MKTVWELMSDLERRLGETLAMPEYLFLTSHFDMAQPGFEEDARNALRFFRKGYESGWDDARMTFDTEG